MYLFELLIRMIAPILVFTAEDAYHHYAFKTAASVHDLSFLASGTYSTALAKQEADRLAACLVVAVVVGGIEPGTADGGVLPHALGQAAVIIYRLVARLEPVPASRFSFPARRPNGVILDTRLADALLGPMPDWRAGSDAAVAALLKA